MKHHLSSFISSNSAIKPGDLMFVSGSGWVSKTIQKVTGGHWSHAALVFDKEHVFETEGNIGKSKISPISNYLMKDIAFLRYKGMSTAKIDEFRATCLRHVNIPYSYWDCLQNLILRPLPAKWRRKALSLVGTKAFKKCDELVQHLMAHLFPDPIFGLEEGLDPSALYKRCVASGKFWKVELLSGIVDK